MTATERLRELLDERGVEWEDMSALFPTGMLWCTQWHDLDGEPCAALEGTYDIPDGKLSMQCPLTPEQAIADTLGAGTCHDAGGKYSWGNWTCSECGFVMPSHFKLDELGGPLYRFCPNCGRKVVDA